MAKLRKKIAPALRSLRALGVQLADAPAATPEAAPAADGEAPAVVEIPKQKWIEVATSGSYSGHGDGEFTLDLAVFTQFVANFHTDPRYKAGADGVGMNPVVPFDYEHTSEMDPRLGSIPATGVPAPAWALDLKVEGDATKSSLWAFVDLGDTIRDQISKNEYRFVSIAFTLEATDPHTDVAIGALITSIAFTNHPFLRDLQPLAASARRGENADRKLGYWGDAANSPEQGFEYTRSILGLPAATTTDEVIAEVSKVIAWASTPNTAPAGVDIDDIMCDLRSAWSIPVTWTADQVLEQINKAAASLAALAAPAAAAAADPKIPEINGAPVAADPNAPPPPAGSALPPKQAPALSNTEQTIMDPKKIAALFNSKLKGGRLLADDPTAVEGAVEGAVNDQATLASVLEALGVKDGASALSSIAELMAAKDKLTSALSQLNEVLSMQAQTDEQTEGQDVGAAMSAAGLSSASEQVKTAFRVQRTSMITTELSAVPEKDRLSPKALFDARKKARGAFLAHHGVAEAGRQHLLTNILAAPNGAELEPPTNSQLNARKIPNAAGAKTIDLSSHAGPNRFARILSYVQATEKVGGKDLSWDAANRRANQLANDESISFVE